MSEANRERDWDEGVRIIAVVGGGGGGDERKYECVWFSLLEIVLRARRFAPRPISPVRKCLLRERRERRNLRSSRRRTKNVKERGIRAIHRCWR